MAQVISLWEDKLQKLEHVAAVTRDYSVNPLLGAFPLFLSDLEQNILTNQRVPFLFFFSRFAMFCLTLCRLPHRIDCEGSAGYPGQCQGELWMTDIENNPTRIILQVLPMTKSIINTKSLESLILILHVVNVGLRPCFCLFANDLFHCWIRLGHSFFLFLVFLSLNELLVVHVAVHSIPYHLNSSILLPLACGIELWRWFALISSRSTPKS